jgi:hypothetical protein
MCQTGVGSVHVEFVVDEKYHWNSFFFKYFGCPQSIIPINSSSPTKLLKDKQGKPGNLPATVMLFQKLRSVKKEKKFPCQS